MLPRGGRQDPREKCASVHNSAFIDPPKGAVQFKVTHRPNGARQTPYYTVWVMPTTARFLKKCPCKPHEKFEVLEQCLTADERMERIKSPIITGFAVCSCLGRIVE